MKASGQSGLSLVEVLVAVAVLALAMTTALVLYDGARKSFKVSENVIEVAYALCCTPSTSVI